MLLNVCMITKTVILKIKGGEINMFCVLLCDEELKYYFFEELLAIT